MSGEMPDYRVAQNLIKSIRSAFWVGDRCRRVRKTFRVF